MQTAFNDIHQPIPPGIAESWPKIMAGLNTGSESDQWKIDKSSTNVTTPADLFIFNGTDRNEMIYTRQLGDVQCSLSMTVDPPQYGLTAQYQLSEDCRHDIHLFGGWECNSRQYCKQ